MYRYPPGTLMRVALAFDAYNADIVAGGSAYFRDDCVMRECLADHGTPPRCSCAQCYAGRGLKLDVSFHIGRQPQYQCLISSLG